ncbi:SDR family NAD(P)-dependent oxidoreductase [Streptomyces erythrochromogenes]|uniref:SDR family NAD(P)-dependent oxidoreductase n=1 Tax=Streptomyces erythrochromogenes TaxID=285574 RepID=UPI003F4DB960
MVTTTLHGVALVTGGSPGIGAEIARTLAAHGADVAITYRSNKEQAEEVAGQVRALGRRAATVEADAADAEAVTAAADRVVREPGPDRPGTSRRCPAERVRTARAPRARRDTPEGSGWSWPGPGPSGPDQPARPAGRP